MWPAIKRQPIEGLGIGVQWPETSPLPFEYPDNHYFTHFAVLYWWMTCGLMGLAAYLLLMGTTILVGLRLWWRAREPFERIAALSSGSARWGWRSSSSRRRSSRPTPRGTAVFRDRDRHPGRHPRARPRTTPGIPLPCFRRIAEIRG